MALLHSFLFFSLLLILAFKFLSKNRRNNYKNLPPSPPAIPIIGHLHLVAPPLHQALANLSKQYGPVMSLRFGSLPVVVVSSPKAVEECFTKNDVVLANRPQTAVSKYLFYDASTLGAGNYGDHFRSLRRLAATETFSQKRLNTHESLRRDELEIFIRRIHANCSDHNSFTKVNGLRSMLLDLTFNITLRIITGRRYFGENVDVNPGEGTRIGELIREYAECSEATNLRDCFPILNLVDFDGFVSRLVNLGKKMDAFLQGLVEEHRRDGNDRKTMINHLLNMQEEQPDVYTDRAIKGLVLIMLVGGTDSSASAVEFALANLLNNPQVLHKAKNELDAQVGQDRLIEESDLPNLTYLQSIISENLRLCPVAPQLVPHYTSDHCTIQGYDVAPGTMVFVNAWAIQRDPSLWDEPTSFKPERFLNGKVDGYKMLPFGLGRRACPGEGMANRVMGLTLGSMVQCFEWAKVDDKEIDVSQVGMITSRMVEPLEVMAKARSVLGKIFPEINKDGNNTQLFS